MVYASPHVTCTKYAFIFKGASNKNIFKLSMAGLKMYGILLTGRSSRVHSCPLDLSSASRPQRAFMAGSTLAVRSPRYLLMQSILIINHSVYSQMKIKNIF
jgi:hypothetical protein